MKIIYGKTLSLEENNLIYDVAEQCDILFDTAKLLYYRGVDTVEKAKKFLSPDKKGFNNPFLLNGVKQAIARIEKAKELNENVFIFGDYDADGVCATTVLYYCLLEFGITASFYVPEREEGYGINVETIKRFNEQKSIDLIITVDCGVSDKDKIEQLNQMGIDVIVTDHHEPPEDLPECITINPKIKGQEYPFDGLCGAGVAYKLGYALIGENANKYLDFVAVATVADSMDLVEENRDITVEGLKILNDPKRLRLPFKYLLNDNIRQITAQTIAYNIAPRINAGGRMGDANTALNLFTEQSTDKIYSLAVKLSEYNVARQVECDNIYREAKDRIKKYSLYKNDIILVKDERWNPGFIGIVAAKLVEDFSRPVIVFAGHDGHLKGSARSVDGVNIYDAICSVKDLLLGFGGHSQAAGVSIEKENFSKLDKQLNSYAKKTYGVFDTEKKMFAEWQIDKPFSLRFAKEVESLEPFGVGNRRPMFALSVGEIDSLPLKAGSPHYSFKTDFIEVLDFNGESNVATLAMPIEKIVLFELNLSSFKGRESLKAYSRKIVANYNDFKALSLEIINNELDKVTCYKQDEFESITKKDVDFSIRTGTLFVINDPNTFAEYEELKNLPISLFVPENKGVQNCVIVSPKEIPEGFDKVIYLDKPLGCLTTSSKNYCVQDIDGCKWVDNLQTDRSDFARIFNLLTSLNGKPINTITNFVRKYSGDEDPVQTLFVAKVFLELNIFNIKNGYFYYDQKIKNALTNSKLYSKIYSLKGLL